MIVDTMPEMKVCCRVSSLIIDRESYDERLTMVQYILCGRGSQ